MKTVILVLATMLLLVGCTENERAKHFGGEATIRLDPGMKLINLTWKEDDLWIQQRPFREGEVPETTVFKEESSYGLMSGSVIVTESK